MEHGGFWKTIKEISGLPDMKAIINSMKKIGDLSRGIKIWGSKMIWSPGVWL